VTNMVVFLASIPERDGAHSDNFVVHCI